MLVLVRGAGDLATGVAIRLMRAGMDVVLTEIATPTAIRRTVAFSEAVTLGETTVEDVRVKRAESAKDALCLAKAGVAAVLIDPEAKCREELRPGALVDAILAKRNTGTKIADAPVVVALGPGFTAGTDCHAAVETMRGHDLGRVYYTGSPLPNTGTPGEIGGKGMERLLRAPADGIFTGKKQIGELVEAGETVAEVNGIPMKAAIAGVLRGLLPDVIYVKTGMKSGDIDPRGNIEACFTVSDKARALGGAVLEAILHFTKGRI